MTVLAEAVRIIAFACNTLAPQAARRDRDRALHLVEVCWEVLSTTAAWHAAHHSYVGAVDTVRTAITAWADAAHAWLRDIAAEVGRRMADTPV
ncbi:hypothetical protein AB0E83_33920 [Streptomyces sp. NPDC035033]|uniref:hypothetical protein n=1 Tax=Streptomyces sp. NPDC035033 TaxID=3155368 RepID=UPI0033E82E35